MDQHSPDDYIDAGAEAALAGAREVVDYVQVRRRHVARHQHSQLTPA